MELKGYTLGNTVTKGLRLQSAINGELKILSSDVIGFYAPMLKSSKSEIDPPAPGSDVTEERKDNNVFSGQSYVRIASIYAGLIW